MEPGYDQSDCRKSQLPGQGENVLEFDGRDGLRTYLPNHISVDCIAHHRGVLCF